MKRRIVDQVIADWRFERATALARGDQWGARAATLHGVVALIRVAAHEFGASVQRCVCNRWCVACGQVGCLRDCRDHGRDLDIAAIRSDDGSLSDARHSHERRAAIRVLQPDSARRDYSNGSLDWAADRVRSPIRRPLPSNRRCSACSHLNGSGVCIVIFGCAAHVARLSRARPAGGRRASSQPTR